MSGALSIKSNFIYLRVLRTIMPPILKLEILYCDEHFVAVNKPHGLLVHRSSIASDASEFALQILRNQIDRYVYPVHRLDRKTSGVLLFCYYPETVKVLQQLFTEGNVHKQYLAIVRGITEDSAVIDYPLRREDGTFQDAVTNYRTVSKTEIPYPFGIHETSRYSLVSIYPETGRMHQIRKHFAHILHPIIGDRPHGCNKQNRFFKETWNMTTMMLHALSLTFTHPFSEKKVIITATIHEEFRRMMQLMGWNEDLISKFSSFSDSLE